MKVETLIRRGFEHETPTERLALKVAAETAGTFPECSSCGRCVASCELILNEYESVVDRIRTSR
jgi:ferredoxin